MPRYYLDVRSRFGLDEDLNGLDLPDLDAAHAVAMEMGHRLWERLTGAPPDARRDIAIEIIDEGFEMVLVIPYPEVEGGQQLPSQVDLILPGAGI
jgi:hypothetical protein